MRVRFKADKSIEFLDGSGTINTNDVMRQTLEVEVEDGVIATGESLWVVFQRDELEVTKNLMLEEVAENEKYKILIPSEVLAIPGEWKIQLLVRLYKTTDESKYVQQLASDEVSITVADGLYTEESGAVTDETILSLYQKANNEVDKAEDAARDAAGKAIEAGASASAAAASAYNAKQSEDNALSYKNAAETAANNAAQSETNANTSAFSALDQANRAQSLADSAQTSATTAENAAERAETERSFAYYSIEAETARDYSKGSKIDKIFKDILKRLENLENKSI